MPMACGLRANYRDEKTLVSFPHILERASLLCQNRNRGKTSFGPTRFSLGHPGRGGTLSSLCPFAQGELRLAKGFSLPASCAKSLLRTRRNQPILAMLCDTSVACDQGDPAVQSDGMMRGMYGEVQPAEGRYGRKRPEVLSYGFPRAGHLAVDACAGFRRRDCLPGPDGSGDVFFLAWPLSHGKRDIHPETERPFRRP